MALTGPGTLFWAGPSPRRFREIRPSSPAGKGAARPWTGLHPVREMRDGHQRQYAEQFQKQENDAGDRCAHRGLFLDLGGVPQYLARLTGSDTVTGGSV